MQEIFRALKQTFVSSILIVSLIFFTCLSGLFIVVQQASYATTLEELKLIPPEYKPDLQEKINRAYEYDPGVGVQEEERQQAYEQATKDAENLNTLEKAYERNLKAGKQQDSQNNIVTKAKEAVENVIGK